VAPKLSILIINWNGWRDLRNCLASIEVSDGDGCEVLVIDNGSNDGSADHVRRQFPKVRVHANPSNVGAARALNQGLELAGGEYILRLDADTELHRDGIRRLLRFMAERPDVAVAAPRMYNTDGSVQETARNFPSVLSGLFGRHSLLTRVFPNNRFSCRYLARDNLQATEPFQVQQVSGACMLMRRSVIAEVGPWDEAYPQAYWDDTDWCLRLNKLGKKIYCIPQAGVVHHEGNQPGKKKSPSRIWMFHRGAYRLYRKHYTGGALDPRAWLALTVLSLRAALIIMRNHFGRAAPGNTSARTSDSGGQRPSNRSPLPPKGGGGSWETPLPVPQSGGEGRQRAPRP
jgi:GT2 family glycosyltransferase